MTLPNHLAGGFVFTGFFASLAGINVLESPQALGALALGAMLPDIDHTRSLIGRVFLPLSRFLNRRYGHRTLTHSLTGLFFFSVAAGILEQAYFQSQRWTVIASLAYLSHLFLDMMTLQGVLLFYPVFKNPCVIPGQASLRIRTGDLRRETFLFCTFLIAGLSMQNLYRQGFWNTYNRTFGTLKHLASEFVKSPDAIWVEYAYREGSHRFRGTGYCIEASDRRATLLTSEGFLLLDASKQVIERILPERTSQPFRFETTFFNALSPDSLNRLLTGKHLLELDLQHPHPFSVWTGSAAAQPAKTFTGTYLHQVRIIPLQEDAGEMFFPESDAKIAALRQEIRLLQQQDREALADYQRLQQELQSLEAAVEQMEDLFEAQRTANRIRELRKLKRPEGHEIKIAALHIQIQQLETEIAHRNRKRLLEMEQRNRQRQPEKIGFSGHAKWVEID